MFNISPYPAPDAQEDDPHERCHLPPTIAPPGQADKN